MENVIFSNGDGSNRKGVKHYLGHEIDIELREIMPVLPFIVKIGGLQTYLKKMTI